MRTLVPLLENALRCHHKACVLPSASGRRFGAVGCGAAIIDRPVVGGHSSLSMNKLKLVRLDKD